MAKDNKGPVTVKRNYRLDGKPGKHDLKQHRSRQGVERKPRKYVKSVFSNNQPLPKQVNAIIVDTSVLIHNPESINVLLDHGQNVLYLPLQVLMELDNLKNKPHVGIEAREAIRIIDEIQTKESSSDKRHHLQLLVDTSWAGLENLSKDKPDNIILAAANYVLVKEQTNYRKIKFLSCDRVLRIVAKRYMAERGLEIEDYWQDQSGDLDAGELPRINVPLKIIESSVKEKNTFFFRLDKLSKRDRSLLEAVPENGGAVCFSDWDGNHKRAVEKNSEFKANFAAIRKGQSFKIINKDIAAYSIKPYSMNGNGYNFEQAVALEQLLSDDIKVVILEGPPGTGKTLLGVAAALAQREKFRQILVTRPLVHLQGEDNMGFLPGGIDKKMAPWLKPIWEALDELKEAFAKNSNYSTNEPLREAPLKNRKHSVKDVQNKFKGQDGWADKEKTEEQKIKDYIHVEPLDYIRGRSIRNSFLIIDEGQNLTPHEIKTISTRMAQGSKLVITGDLSQIDRRNLDRRSSGLAFAIDRLLDRDNLENSKLAPYVHMFAAVRLQQSVRSDTAFYASEVMS